MSRLIALLCAVSFLVGLVGPAVVDAQPTKSASPTEAGKSGSAPAKKSAPMDINSASEDELKTLPGIGDAYAKKIVENRPYKRKDELVSKKILPKTTYDKIKDQIIAKQSTTKK
jgi:DNA uptake protein ComE-like DNA-binding protein